MKKLVPKKIPLLLDQPVFFRLKRSNNLESTDIICNIRKFIIFIRTRFKWYWGTIKKKTKD